MSEDINAIVNYGIDSPLNRAENENRPMWEWIIQNKEYKEKYHKAINELITNYFESDKFNNLVDSTYSTIKPYLELDVSFFYTQDQVEKGIETLKEFCSKRTESIRKQLDGKLSTITTEQIETDRINASSINLEDMGLVADDSLMKEENENNDRNHDEKKR